MWRKIFAFAALLTITASTLAQDAGGGDGGGGVVVIGVTGGIKVEQAPDSDLPTTIKPGTVGTLERFKITVSPVEDVIIQELELLISDRPDGVPPVSQVIDEVPKVSLYSPVTGQIGPVKYYSVEAGGSGMVFVSNLNWHLTKGVEHILEIQAPINSVEQGADIGTALFTNIWRYQGVGVSTGVAFTNSIPSPIL